MSNEIVILGCNTGAVTQVCDSDTDIVTRILVVVLSHQTGGGTVTPDCSGGTTTPDL